VCAYETSHLTVSDRDLSASPLAYHYAYGIYVLPMYRHLYVMWRVTPRRWHFWFFNAINCFWNSICSIWVQHFTKYSLVFPTKIRRIISYYYAYAPRTGQRFRVPSLNVLRNSSRGRGNGSRYRRFWVKTVRFNRIRLYHEYK